MLNQCSQLNQFLIVSKTKHLILNHHHSFELLNDQDWLQSTQVYKLLSWVNKRKTTERFASFLLQIMKTQLQLHWVIDCTEFFSQRKLISSLLKSWINDCSVWRFSCHAYIEIQMSFNQHLKSYNWSIKSWSMHLFKLFAWVLMLTIHSPNQQCDESFENWKKDEEKIDLWAVILNSINQWC